MANDAYAAERIRETAMVDLAYEHLKSVGEPMLYRDILKHVTELKGFTQEDVERYIAQLYTEINIDGRFVCVGRSLWGLKHWYTIEQSTDSAIVANVKEDDDLLDDEDLYDSEDDIFTDELDALDSETDDFDDDDPDNDFDDDETDDDEDEEY
jgi:DNA-directed RNA polymerase subunit delta